MMENDTSPEKKWMARYMESKNEIVSSSTLPKTNIAPENGWLEDEFPFGMAYWKVLC